MNHSDFFQRYARQINLESVGLEGQLRLQKARVLVVGVGGLGAPVSLYLAAAGVGTLGLIDPDFVDLSNLQRQILFDTTEKGQAKVDAAARRLNALNPNCQIETYQDCFHETKAESLAAKYDLIIDGSDNFATKFLICDVAHKLNKPMVYGAVDQFEGQVGLFQSQRGSCYRCMYSREPQSKIRNCVEAGVIGSLVGVIGSIQSTLAINWIVSGGEPTHPLCPPIGTIMLLKLDSFESHKFQVAKNPHCSTCSKSPAAIELTFQRPPVCSLVMETDWAEAVERVREKKAILVDVREQEEWAQGHLPGAYHLPLSKIQSGEQDLPSTELDLIFYCQKGLRSAEALRILKTNDQSKMFTLRGGIEHFL